MAAASPSPDDSPSEGASTVRTDLKRTMPLTEALQLAMRNAGKDPNEAIGVFDWQDVFLVNDRKMLPPRGQGFIVLFRDFTFVEASIRGTGEVVAANQ
jgi:hypothetical protein